MALDAASCTPGTPDRPADDDRAVAGTDSSTADTDVGELVDCPECGEPSNPVQISTWGHCRACRTADSRATRPLRW